MRRKMDEMLKTWKEPVPGSMDTQPVFPPEITRPIENALIKARTSAVQAHQEHLRNQQQLLGRGRPGSASVPYRNTPTPPNAMRQAGQAQPGYVPYNQSTLPNGQQYPGQTNGSQPYGLPQVSLHLIQLYSPTDLKKGANPSVVHTPSSWCALVATATVSGISWARA